MRSFLVSQLRRRVGLVAVQAMARHRLARVPYIGASRAHVVALQRRREAARLARAERAGGWAGGGAPDFDPRDLYVFQAGGGGAGG